MEIRIRGLKQLNITLKTMQFGFTVNFTPTYYYT